MIPAMRRKRQALSPADCAAILEKGTSGVLALCGAEGRPYAVPLSYLFAGGKLYFHSARAGYKLDLIRENPSASFCVIGQDLVVPEEYTTYFTSVIAFGTVRVLEDDARKRAAIDALARKYAPDSTDEDRCAAIDREWTPRRPSVSWR